MPLHSPHAAAARSPSFLAGLALALCLLAPAAPAWAVLVDGPLQATVLPEQDFTAAQSDASLTNPSFTYTGVPTYGTITISYGPYFHGQTATDPLAPPTSVSGTPTNPLSLALDELVDAPANDPNNPDYPYSWKTVVEPDNAAGTTYVLGGVPEVIGGQDFGITNGFGGPIAILFSIPVSGVQLTAGFFDTLGTTQIEGFTVGGASIGSVVNTDLGFETFSLNDDVAGELIGGLLLTTSDPGGFGLKGVGLLQPTNGPVPVPAPGSWAVLPGLLLTGLLGRRKRPACTALAALLVAASVPAAAQSLDCVVEPEMQVKVGSPIATTLESVDVKRGDTVTKGQVLARLVSGVEVADVALAEARARSTAEIDSRRSRLDFAQGDLLRGTKLLVGANIAPQKVDELRTNYLVAQQDLVTAELNHQIAILDLARSQALLNARIIRSPVDGLVTQRSLVPGEFVHQDNNIVVLAVISPLHIQAYPPVPMFSQIKLGQTARVVLTEPAGAIRAVTVTVVDQVFDAASGTFGVELTMANPGNVVPAGQRCRVAFGDETPTLSARTQ